MDKMEFSLVLTELKKINANLDRIAKDLGKN
jgi:hypothetical protein